MNEKDKLRYETMSKRKRKSSEGHYLISLIAIVAVILLEVDGRPLSLFLAFGTSLIALWGAYVGYWEHWFRDEEEKRKLLNELSNS